MEIRADEISRIIREQIQDYGKKVDVAETGSVLSQADGVARIHGLSGAAAGELLEFPGGVRGLVLNLEEDNVGAAIMGPYEHIREGDPVKRTGKIAEVLRAFGELADRELGRLRAKVTSAVALEDGAVEALSQRLSELTRQTVLLEQSVEPALLGGVVAQVGSVVYDGSVRTQLEDLRRSLKR